MALTKVCKRDGSIVNFDKEKIVNAIFKAVQAVGGSDRKEVERVADEVEKYLDGRFKGMEFPTVEDVQDAVEKQLIETGHATTAKSYILYRHRKSVEREMKRLIGVKDDLKLSLNAIQVLERRYLLRDGNGKIAETPSALFRRVAHHIASAEKIFGGDDSAAQNYEEAFYEIITNFEFLPNSPTLMNAGTPLGQLSACFVLGVPDNIEGIFDSVKNTAIIHQSGGGTGFCFSRLRPKGDFVKSTAGVASGPISFMSVFDNATNVIKQGGKRRGANMGVLHVWHPDIEEFVTAKQTPGVLENFNVSVGVDDRFMKAVENDTDYELLNPRTQAPIRTIKARSLFKLIAYSAWKSAEPGVLFMDTINKANPTPKQMIYATNPCIVGNSRITTNEGLVRMDKLHNPHHLLTMEGDYSKVSWVGKTGEKEVFRVVTQAGYELQATEGHKFYVSGSGWKEVKELKEGDRLVLQGEGNFGTMKMDNELALLLGWLIGDGCMTKDMQDVIFYFNKEEKAEMLETFKRYLDGLNGREVKPRTEGSEIRLKYSAKIAKMFHDLGVRPWKSADEKEIPEAVFSLDREGAKRFISALFGSDGSVQGNATKGVSVRLASNSLKMLKQAQLLLLQFGIRCKVYENRRKEHRKKMPDSRRQPKVYLCRPQHELVITRASMFRFMKEIGFCLSAKNAKFERIRPGDVYSDADDDAAVKSVARVGTLEVFDATEPKTHSFFANGILVHNCGEVPMPDFESCNLGSINMSKFVEIDWSKGDWRKKVNWKRLRYVIRLGVQFLDNVIELNKYPIEQIRQASMSNRRIGLGVMGFAKMLTKIGIRYNSPEAFQAGEEVMRFITEEARKMSHELGRLRGSFPNFKDSTWASKYDAMRNATVTSIAPTGTISMIANTSSGIEPIFALAYIKTVMDGTRLYYSDEVFEHVLKVRGLYSIELMQKVIDTGTIQKLDEIPDDIRKVFNIAYDLSAEDHVKMQAAFQKYTDLAVSKTINMPSTATVEDVENAYVMAWKTGCKGVTVYRDKSRGEQVLTIGGNAPAKEGQMNGNSS